MAMLQFILLLVVISIGASNAGPEFDFEDSSQINSFDSGGQPNSQRSIVSGYSKSGKKSLLWQWGARTTDVNPSLTLKLDAQTTIKGKELKNGGIKFWMYRINKNPVSKMNIVFQDYNEVGRTVTKGTPAVQVILDFKGWRAVWIGYVEFGLQSTTLHQLNRVEFTITTDNEDKLYIDLFRFAKEMDKQTRDKVVPEVPMIGISNPRNYNTHPLLYDEKNYWQQSLRWDKYTQYSTPKATDVPDAGLDAKINEINDIEERLDEWYAKTDESLTYFQTTDGCDKKKRWTSLQRNIEDAHDLYTQLSFNFDERNNIIISGPPLFSKISKLGEDAVGNPKGKAKFGFIFTKILLPLSLEYYLMNRDEEVESLAHNECQNLKLNKDDPSFQMAIANIAGKNILMRNEFQNMVEPFSNVLNCKSRAKVEQLIKNFNKDVRFGRILRLLNYVENEGWAAGSGLGSLDHEMNKAGAGFMHSMFLLRHELRKDPDMLTKLLKTMKWYNDFNEIYQQASQYSYDGTSADRMRTILLYRLMIILIPPRPTATQDKKQKVYDMNCFKSWFENTLKINKGLGGVIKPDYTGFHHMTFFGSAYVPQALHNAAFVKYLLGDGANFALGSTSSENLRKALGVLRIVAVKYSTPNGICGRFPNYQKSILSEHFPAYAYMSYIHEETPNLHQEDAEIFLRLFDVNDPAIEEYLSDGRVRSSIYYLNSIGSIDILCKVKSLAMSKGFSEEVSPNGHWSKNFAALSTHRRGDWSVAAKGFSKYTWDFENSAKENVFGVFQSYGSLQISNSEDALRKYDVTEGWDWTKVPGATTVNIDLLNMITDKSRYYSPNGGFAGGVSLSGNNGVFGMNLKELPNYKTKSKSSPLATMDFSFRKTYFFYDNLIVCIGNRITLNLVGSGYHAQTTLFQDKLLDPAYSSTIDVDGATHDLRVLYEKGSWLPPYPSEVTLEDTSGNTYLVKNPSQSGLKIKISDQDSRERDGCKKTKGRYATAWLEHSSTYNHYEYAILIDGHNSNLLRQYTVRNRGGVHTVEVVDDGKITVGYSVFRRNQRMPSRSQGPVQHVDKPCLIMTSEKGSQLHLAISDPSIKFKDVPSPNPLTCSRRSLKDFENGMPKSNYLDPTDLGDVGAKLLFCVEGKKNKITVTLRKDVKRVRVVRVNGEDKTTEKNTHVTFDANKPRELKFLNLLNGFTTELELEI